MLASVLTVAAILALPAAASGAVVFGSNLASAPMLNTNCTLSCTTANSTLDRTHLAGRALNSPVTGTVTSFSVRSGSTGNVSLRILRPVGVNTFTGAGTSGLVSIGVGITGPIAVALPIQEGNAIGLDNPNAHLVLAANPRAAQIYWTPPLADGSTLTGATASGLETMVQATVEPSNELDFGKVRRNEKQGTARVTVEVPNEGVLNFSGNKVGVSAGGGASAARTVRVGELTVKIRAKGKKRRNLNSKGKVTVKPVFTYTPTNGLTSEQSRKLKLRKK